MLNSSHNSRIELRVTSTDQTTMTDIAARADESRTPSRTTTYGPATRTPGSRQSPNVKGTRTEQKYRFASMGLVISRSFAAVLWDMDGTLVDTEPLWMAAEHVLVGRFGGSWTREQALQLVGCALEHSARVLQSAGVRMSEDEIIEELTTEVMAAMRNTRVLPFRPGARELLVQLREAGTKTALVTMSRRRMADFVVNLIDFDAFDVVIPGDEVTRPKPFPDPYLQACAALQVSPEQAVAIEDSPNGLRSAVASQVTSIGVPLMVPLDGLGADAVLTTLGGVTVSDLITIHRARPERTPVDE